jgi:hypothetical protein
VESVPESQPSQASTDPQIRLEYAPASPRRGWPVRRWILVVGGVVLIYLAAHYGIAVVRNVRVQVTQSRCAGFEFPAGTVVYESGGTARALRGDETVIDDLSIWPAKAILRKEPACWASLKDLLFGARQFWPPGPPAPKAMVHKLRNAKGDQRLVAIIVAPSAPGQLTPTSRYRLGLVAAVVAPGGWGEEPTWIGNGDFLIPGFESATSVKIYAGRVDPSDAARFTIPYEMDGQAGTIEGRFASDGEVKMQVKDGPAAKTQSVQQE